MIRCQVTWISTLRYDSFPPEMSELSSDDQLPLKHNEGWVHIGASLALGQLDLLINKYMFITNAV